MTAATIRTNIMIVPIVKRIFQLNGMASLLKSRRHSEYATTGRSYKRDYLAPMTERRDMHAMTGHPCYGLVFRDIRISPDVVDEAARLLGGPLPLRVLAVKAASDAGADLQARITILLGPLLEGLVG